MEGEYRKRIGVLQDDYRAGVLEREGWTDVTGYLRCDLWAMLGVVWRV